MQNMRFWDAKSFGEWRRSDKSDEELYLELLKSSEYQGWSGHSTVTSAFITWAVALHLDNDQYWYDDVVKIIKKYGKNEKWKACQALETFVTTEGYDHELDGHLTESELAKKRQQSRKARALLRDEFISKAEGAINWGEIWDHYEWIWDEESVEEGLED